MDENWDLYKQTLTYNVATGPYQCLTTPWWIRARHKVYEPRHRCELEALNCGQDVFARIQADILAAESSIDIVTWGFDPGMVLVRNGLTENGLRYGDLLKQVASCTDKPVTVRLLLWHDDLMSHGKMKNNPGYYGGRFPTIGASAGYLSESHEKYNVAWFDDVRANKFPNIILRVREVPLQYKNTALAGEIYDIKVTGWLGTLYPTHHQKMVLIDYELPSRAVGYVMGHNSTTDFWDTAAHSFNDPLRETLYRKNPIETDLVSQLHAVVDDANDYFWEQTMPPERPRVSRKAERTNRFHREHAFTAKPYQDVSLRMQGPILYDLNHNFCQGWADSFVPNSAFMQALWMTPPGVMVAPLVKVAEAVLKLDSEVCPRLPTTDAAFIARREKVAWNAFKRAKGQHSAQLMRTQPMYGEKGIKECYANLTRRVQHYMFIQNQYVQYEAWATQLKKCVANLRAFGAGYTKPIYLFILTSTPETSGMDLPTYAVAKKLGQSHTMPVEHKEVEEKAKKRKAAMPITPNGLARQGINVVMGSLWTCKASPKSAADYEEIYIHAKVAIVDDAAFTIGSANLSVRSMALDSELNVLSQAQDVAYGLRTALFKQCTDDFGPSQFGDMESTFDKWLTLSKNNHVAMKMGQQLRGQLVQFHVNRKPGSPVM
ncbi:MAG: phospholipase D-like domain-containing protein [Pseudomonadota bacterium]